MKMRHEYKHLINYADYLVLKSRLGSLLGNDPHADAHGSYRVRSIYFDNLADKALMEKIDGIDRREKFRIRIYNDDHSFIRLEKKVKIKGLCGKKSATLSKQQAQQILQGDLGWMQQDVRPLIVELYNKMITQQLRPKTIVEYIREPFIFVPGNVRITLDYDIRTGLHATDFFDPALALLPSEEHFGVLEVKYDEYLPGLVQDIVQLSVRQTAAYSKYAICRRFD